MFTLKFLFQCADNTYLTFVFDTAINAECTDANVKKLIQAIIDNGSIFTSQPVKCVYAKRYGYQPYTTNSGDSYDKEYKDDYAAFVYTWTE